MSVKARGLSPRLPRRESARGVASRFPDCEPSVSLVGSAGGKALCTDRASLAKSREPPNACFKYTVQNRNESTKLYSYGAEIRLQLH